MLFLCVFLGFKLVEFQKYEKIGRFKSVVFAVILAPTERNKKQKLNQLTKSASQANFTNYANFTPAIMKEIKGRLN